MNELLDTGKHFLQELRCRAILPIAPDVLLGMTAYDSYLVVICCNRSEFDKKHDLMERTRLGEYRYCMTYPYVANAVELPEGWALLTLDNVLKLDDLRWIPGSEGLKKFTDRNLKKEFSLLNACNLAETGPQGLEVEARKQRPYWAEAEFSCYGFCGFCTKRGNCHLPLKKETSMAQGTDCEEYEIDRSFVLFKETENIGLETY